MAIDITFEEYREELEAVIRQNPNEADLYPLVWCLLKSCGSFGDLSVRCTANLQHSEKVSTDSRLYSYLWTKQDGSAAYKYGSLDFVIFKKNSFFDIDSPVGAIEVKVHYLTLDKHHDNIRNAIQLTRGLNKFGTVIYTNGLEWKAVKNGMTFDDADTVCLGVYTDKNGDPVNDEKRFVLSDDRIKWNGEESWNELKNMLDNIKWGK